MWEGDPSPDYLREALAFIYCLRSGTPRFAGSKATRVAEI